MVEEFFRLRLFLALADFFFFLPPPRDDDFTVFQYLFFSSVAMRVEPIVVPVAAAVGFGLYVLYRQQAKPPQKRNASPVSPPRPPELAVREDSTESMSVTPEAMPVGPIVPDARPFLRPSAELIEVLSPVPSPIHGDQSSLDLNELLQRGRGGAARVRVMKGDDEIFEAFTYAMRIVEKTTKASQPAPAGYSYNTKRNEFVSGGAVPKPSGSLARRKMRMSRESARVVSTSDPMHAVVRLSHSSVASCGHSHLCFTLACSSTAPHT